MIWTVAQDRWIVCYRKRNNEPATSTIIEYKIPTQGGYVYCMEACPIDTSRIAFGVGDMMLRSWNLSEPHTTSFDITMHWQKIKGKIRAVKNSRMRFCYEKIISSNIFIYEIILQLIIFSVIVDAE